MNQENIGKFIAECRKNKNLTQVQLANLLGTTDKSISKWENGNCLPDSSLYESLCEILNISINELFAGKRITDEDYKKVADDNLMKLLIHNLYNSSDKSISFDEFDNSINKISETATLLSTFKTKEDALNYLMKETKLSFEDCSGAYDIYINLYKLNK